MSDGATAPAGTETTTNTGGLRHRAEIPLLVVGSILFALAVPLVSEVLVESIGLWWTTVIVGGVMGLYVGRGMLNAYERANSVRITEQQFPQIHRRIADISREFGLAEPPDAFVVQEGGVLNAFASRHHRTSFIRINADILEVGAFGLGPRPRDPAALDFVIAHEIGHAAAGHVGFWYTLVSNFVASIPPVGQALSRAKEYTADNHAYAAVPEGIGGMLLLSGGKHLYRDVDAAQFVERARTDRGLFLWMASALSTHPILTKRIAALTDRSRPGRIF